MLACCEEGAASLQLFLIALLAQKVSALKTDSLACPQQWVRAWLTDLVLKDLLDLPYKEGILALALGFNWRDCKQAGILRRNCNNFFPEKELSTKSSSSLPPPLPLCHQAPGPGEGPGGRRGTRAEGGMRRGRKASGRCCNRLVTTCNFGCWEMSKHLGKCTNTVWGTEKSLLPPAAVHRGHAELVWERLDFSAAGSMPSPKRDTTIQQLIIWKLKLSLQESSHPVWVACPRQEVSPPFPALAPPAACAPGTLRPGGKCQARPRVL